MQEKNLYLKILSFLSKEDALLEYIDISHFFNKYFNEFEDSDVVIPKNPRTKKIVKYLELIKGDGLINYIDRSQYANNYEMKTEYNTPIKFEACITIKGIEFYNSHLLRRKTINSIYWTRILSITAILISLCSTIYNIYSHKQAETRKQYPKLIELPKK